MLFCKKYSLAISAILLNSGLNERCYILVSACRFKWSKPARYNRMVWRLVGIEVWNDVYLFDQVYLKCILVISGVFDGFIHVGLGFIGHFKSPPPSVWHSDSTGQHNTCARRCSLLRFCKLGTSESDTVTRGRKVARMRSRDRLMTADMS